MTASACRRWRAALTILAVMSLAGCATTAPDEFTTDGAEKLYKEAKEDLSSGSWERAIKALEKVEARAGGTILAQQAQIDLAYAQWKSGERALSIATLDRFIKLNPSSPGLEYALYLRGLVNFNDNIGFLGSALGQELSERDQRASRDAYQAFKQLVDQFPQSRYSDDARLRMDYIVNAMAEYEIHVARYYYRRGAFLAAANRAQQVITEYPQTPSNEEALYLMVRSYDRLNLPILRDDTKRVLEKNFPKSRFLTAGTEAIPSAERPWWRPW